MLVLIARLNVEQVDWLGTSMGGLIGMSLAALPDTPIRKLVLNDVGPVIARSALQRIAAYVGRDLSWNDFAEGAAYLREICAPFGPLTEPQWAHLARHGLVQGADGRWRLAYDPGIGTPFRLDYLLQDVVLWPLYDAIRVPTLALRGAESDLLARSTWEDMARRGPRARLAEIPGVGHAPMLMDAAQIGIVRDFLCAP